MIDIRNVELGFWIVKRSILVWKVCKKEHFGNISNKVK